MSGLVTMLVTVTRSPPSWLAILPQKFSAATTEIVPPGPVWATPVAAAHPPRHAATEHRHDGERRPLLDPGHRAQAKRE